MNIRNFLLLAILPLTIGLTSCKKEPIEPDPDPPILGCTDVNSLNYNPIATQNDGNCEYAKQYFPTKTGNMWHLEDDVQVFGSTYKINADFEILGDTLLKSGPYQVSYEYLGADQFSQEDLFGYRVDAKGKVYRQDLNDLEAPEILFLDYPLEMGHTWFDTESEDHFSCEVVFHDALSVPAGSFSDVVGVMYTDLSNAQEFTIYFAPGTGILRVEASFDTGFFVVDIDAQLINYTVN